MSLDYDQPATITPLAEHLAGSVAPTMGRHPGAQIADQSSAPQGTQPEKDAALIAAWLVAQWDAGRMPWVKAAEIVRALWPELAEEKLEDGKRKVRKAVETTMQIVSAPGSHGYALRARVSPAQEVEVCNARLSQARKNFRKAWAARKEALRRMTPDFSLEASR